MPKTEHFLKEAFAGECQANRKCLAFAEKAEREGHPRVARLFHTAAKAEGDKAAERIFTFANKAGKVHARLYQGLLDHMEKTQKDYPYYVCSVCGHTVGKEPPDTCRVCGAKARAFQKIE